MNIKPTLKNGTKRLNFAVMMISALLFLTALYCTYYLAAFVVSIVLMNTMLVALFNGDNEVHNLIEKRKTNSYKRVPGYVLEKRARMLAEKAKR